jgi:hypothetical protein
VVLSTVAAGRVSLVARLAAVVVEFSIAIPMPRSRSPHTTMRDLEPPYDGWKAEAAHELRHRHGLEATAIADRIWMQFYVHRLTPKEAADRAEIVYKRTRPITSWLKKK